MLFCTHCDATLLARMMPYLFSLVFILLPSTFHFSRDFRQSFSSPFCRVKQCIYCTFKERTLAVDIVSMYILSLFLQENLAQNCTHGISLLLLLLRLF